MRRREVVLGVAGLVFLTPIFARAEQERIWILGFLSIRNSEDGPTNPVGANVEWQKHSEASLRFPFNRRIGSGDATARVGRTEDRPVIAGGSVNVGDLASRDLHLKSPQAFMGHTEGKPCAYLSSP
jgi:hypothetical protein